jgi:SAM-dependent methyltransferase
MQEYYRERAEEYDAFYRVADRGEDLAQLRAWLVDHVRGRAVLEVAAGTGYWTEVAASVATKVVATDYAAETLAVAKRRMPPKNVDYMQADAFSLPVFGIGFDVGMAHMWWSHIERKRWRGFLAGFGARLKPRATLLMIDQIHVEGLCSPIIGRDKEDNQLTLRKLDNGATYQIIKNFPSHEELRTCLDGICDDIEIKCYRHFWSVSATFL